MATLPITLTNQGRMAFLDLAREYNVLNVLMHEILEEYDTERGVCIGDISFYDRDYEGRESYQEDGGVGELQVADEDFVHFETYEQDLTTSSHVEGEVALQSPV